MKKWFILILFFSFIFNFAYIFFAGNVAEATDMSTFYLGGKMQSFSNSTDEVQAGYYSHQSLSATATGLASANIASGVTIFGKTGTFTTAPYSTGESIIASAPTERTVAEDGSNFYPIAKQISMDAVGFPATVNVYFEGKGSASGWNSYWFYQNGIKVGQSADIMGGTGYQTRESFVTLQPSSILTIEVIAPNGTTTYIRNLSIRVKSPVVPIVLQD